jgi:F-type H+-transporting ATPase subunit delta
LSRQAIARNYAEVLFEVGKKSRQLEEYAVLLDAVAGAVDASPRAQTVFASPRVTKSEKARLLANALPHAPREFVLFLQAVVKRGRQFLFRPMAQQYLALVDLEFNRLRADVTLAREPSEALKESIRQALERASGKEVIARYHLDPGILGGTIVRVGERYYDGSVKRRMTMLRRQLLAK